MSDRYRGRTTRQRNVAEKVAREWAERRAATTASEEAVDLDRASAEAEVELATRPETADGRAPAERARATERRAPTVTKPRPTTADRAGSRGAGRRVPDLSTLPPLLASSGAFAALRERLGDPERVPPRGRHASLTQVPHGAKSFLAATLAAPATGERVVWVARDAEIGDRVAEELAAWLGDPDAIAVLEPRTALAYERSELVADETAARVAALSAWRSGRARVLVASVQALVQHTLAPDELPNPTTPEVLAISAYLTWLSKDGPMGKTPSWRGQNAIAPPALIPVGQLDAKKGEAIYNDRCATCHGSDGQGVQVGDKIAGPLWGPRSWNDGAGAARVYTLAGMIRYSMPYLDPGNISDADAQHVAAFINSKPRPAFPFKDRDYRVEKLPADAVYYTRQLTLSR